MPNWVFNNLTVEGNPEDVAKVKEQLNKPFIKPYGESKYKDGEWVTVLKEEQYDKPIIAFWNIISPNNVHAYVFSESSGLPKTPDGEWFTSDNWYDWNVRNWGTKWDVACPNNDKYSDTSITSESPRYINYAFNTAWAPPVPAIEKLSKQHARVVFTLDYEEETSWGGEIVFRNGIMEELNKYEFRCECGEEYKEEPELDDNGYCPKCTEEKVNG